jgi:hypothetical protein
MPAPVATGAESSESMGIRYAFTDASLGGMETGKATSTERSAK